MLTPEEGNQIHKAAYPNDTTATGILSTTTKTV